MSFAKAVAGAAFHEAYWDCDEKIVPPDGKLALVLKMCFFFDG